MHKVRARDLNEQVSQGPSNNCKNWATSELDDPYKIVKTMMV